MSRRTFEYICSMSRDHMIDEKTCFAYSNGQPMSLYDQVALALRSLSAGVSIVQIGDSLGVHHSTVSQVTWRFVEAMEVKGDGHLRWPTTKTEMADIKSKFELMQGLPNCCGAIDITHIVMKLSPSEEAGARVWLDGKDNHSMLLMGIIDPNLRFLDIVTGLPGSLLDFEMLRNSYLWELGQKGERFNGDKVKLFENAEMQEYIIGDTGFPLLPWLLTPYQGRNLPEAKVEFNKNLLATHILSQRAFARLKQMWKMIDGVMWRPDKHKLPRFLYVCCILHNILIDMEDPVLDTFPLTENHDPGYEVQRCIHAYNYKTAVLPRDELSDYLFPGVMNLRLDRS